LLCSPAKISRIETGGRAVSLRDVRDLCRVYGASDEETQRLMALARESKQSGWWQEHDLPDFLVKYVGLEAAATRISDYESGLVPALLQTEDYAQALIDGMAPTRPVDERNQLVAARMARRRLLRPDSATTYWAIMDEAALRRMVGGPAVMASQMAEIHRCGQQANVTIQVIPFSTGAHPGMDSTFIILDFEEAVPDVVYVEGLVGSLYLERLVDLKRYREAFDQIRAAALSPRDSLALVTKVADTYANQVP